MNLREAVDRLMTRLDEDVAVFARKPWTWESEAEVGALDEELRVPLEIRERGLEYFFDSGIAEEVLGGFPELSFAKKRELLKYYAEHDAFPDWVHGQDEA